MPIGMRDELVAEREFFPPPTLKSYKSQEKQEVKIVKIQSLYYIGCGISSLGIQNEMYFCLKLHRFKGIFRFKNWYL